MLELQLIKELADRTLDDWHNTISTNLIGPFLVFSPSWARDAKKTMWKNY